MIRRVLSCLIASAIAASLLTGQPGGSPPPGDGTPPGSSEARGRKCPADTVTVGGQDVLVILKLLGADREAGCSDEELAAYVKHFDRLDTDGDGRHSKEEYVEKAGYMNPTARRGIFGAADNDADGYVTKTEYILNRIITDEAKGILQAYDSNKDRSISKEEFIKACPLEDKELAAAVFDALDTTADGTISVPEYLRVWGHWARPHYEDQEAYLRDRMGEENAGDELSQLWSHGLFRAFPENIGTVVRAETGAAQGGGLGAHRDA